MKRKFNVSSSLRRVYVLALAAMLFSAAIAGTTAAGAADSLLDNGGFETGDFTSWVVSDLSDPGNPCQTDWHVDDAGVTGCTDVASPAEGTYAAYNSWDGAGPIEYTLEQSFDVPVGMTAAELSWWDTAVWNLVDWCGTGSWNPSSGPPYEFVPPPAEAPFCEDRQFHVDLLDDAGALVERLYTYEIEALTQGSYDWTQRAIAIGESTLEPFWDGSLTVRFTNVVPEAFTGPAGFGLDGVDFAPSEVLDCRGVIATIVGTEGPDLINGTEGDDVIIGRDGDDIIHGNGGDDLICGNGGDDRITGDTGDDVVLGGNGDDTINGNSGNELLRGNNDDDTINGGPGADQVQGKRGNDIVTGGNGNDIVTGGNGDDIVGGGDGVDRVEGNRGDDEVFGDGDDDSVYGNSGADVLWGGDGADTLIGDRGDDIIHGLGGADTLEGNEGNDTIFGGDGDDAIRGGGGNDVIDSGAGLDDVRGNQDNDSITGGDDADILYGNRGDDDIAGDAGDDFLNGGADTDGLDGGDGTDTCLNGESVVNCEL